MKGSEVERVDALASLILRTLLAVRSGERLLLVTDSAGMEENGDIARAIVHAARDSGLEVLLVETNDAPHIGAQYLPDAVSCMMSKTDIVISLTRTTAAPLPHHAVPLSLVRSKRIRGVFMAQRSRADLLGPSVLDPDFDIMARVASTWQPLFEAADSVHITSELGSDFRASLQGMPSHRSDFAYERGTITPVNWGEVYQGPVPGTSQGRVVVDGPILGFGWSMDPVIIEVENGNAVKIDGDARTAPALSELIRRSENGANIAEIAVGINPRANGRNVNVFKKGLGRCHIALGSGEVYDQPISSPIHIDCVLASATIKVGDIVIVRAGTPALPELELALRRSSIGS